MSILILNPELEAKITALGKRQQIPVKKATMAHAILAAAVADQRGQPIDKWRDQSRKFTPQENPE